MIDSFPEHVLNYKDSEGRTIIDDGFYPFQYNRWNSNITKLKEGDLFLVSRPHYIVETIECNGKELKVIKEKVEGNIQDAIDNKVKHIYIHNYCEYPCNSFEDDIYRILDAGHVQAISIDGNLKSNGKIYHVDFIHSDEIGDNITSYYNRGRKNVVLEEPVTNNLITLEQGGVPAISKFSGDTNVRDILDMIDALKAKVEAL